MRSPCSWGALRGCARLWWSATPTCTMCWWVCRSYATLGGGVLDTRRLTFGYTPGMQDDDSSSKLITVPLALGWGKQNGGAQGHLSCAVPDIVFAAYAPAQQEEPPVQEPTLEAAEQEEEPKAEPPPSPPPSGPVRPACVSAACAEHGDAGGERAADHA